MIVSRIRSTEEKFTGRFGREYLVDLHICQDVPKIGDPVTLYEVSIRKRCVTQNVYKCHKYKYFTDKEEAIKYYVDESEKLRKPKIN